MSPIPPAPAWGSFTLTGLTQFTLILILTMIYVVARWLYSEIERRHAWEDHADHERAQIKADAERAVRESAAFTKILQQFPAVEDRHLHSVHRHRR